MKNILFIFFVCLRLLCFGEEIQVGLKTQDKLIPLHLQLLEDRKSFLSLAYQEKIKNLFLFDLTQSAFFQMDAENSQHLKIQIQFNKTSLHTTFIDPMYQKKKKFKTVILSGDLSKDRTLVHQLSDKILKEITGNQGVATTKILYSLRKKTIDGWLSEIWICDYDGANAKMISSASSYCVSPCYIPVESYLGFQYFLYVCYRTGQPKIYSATLKNPRGSLLLSLRGNQLLPSISKQGDKIAFVSDAGGRPDLFIQYFDVGGKAVGKPIQLFSLPRATQASSTFSPDGKQIAFVSDKDGPPRIYLAQIPQTISQTRPKTTLLTKKNRHNTSPAWSPDGSKLAYSAKVNGIRQIWIYDFEREEECQLTDGPHHKENPSWAPNSLHLIYNSEGEKQAELFMINTKQKKPLQITQGIGLKRFPSWEPKNVQKGE